MLLIRGQSPLVFFAPLIAIAVWHVLESNVNASPSPVFEEHFVNPEQASYKTPLTRRNAVAKSFAQTYRLSKVAPESFHAAEEQPAWRKNVLPPIHENATPFEKTSKLEQRPSNAPNMKGGLRFSFFERGRNAIHPEANFEMKVLSSAAPENARPKSMLELLNRDQTAPMREDISFRNLQASQAVKDENQGETEEPKLSRYSRSEIKSKTEKLKTMDHELGILRDEMRSNRKKANLSKISLAKPGEPVKFDENQAINPVHKEIAKLTAERNIAHAEIQHMKASNDLKTYSNFKKMFPDKVAKMQNEWKALGMEVEITKLEKRKLSLKGDERNSMQNDIDELRAKKNSLITGKEVKPTNSVLKGVVNGEFKELVPK